MNMMKPIYMISYIHISMSYVSMMNDKYLSDGNLSSECPRSPDHMERFACPKPDRRGRFRCIDDRYIDTSSHGYITSGQRNTSSYFPDDLTNHDISLFFRALCDGFYDCPDKEDENPDHCLFYKTVGFHNSQTIFSLQDLYFMSHRIFKPNPGILQNRFYLHSSTSVDTYSNEEED